MRRALALAVLIGGCSAQPIGTATLQPTADPTATQSATSSAADSPSPTATATALQIGDWDDFQSHTEDAVGDLGTLLLEAFQVIEDDPPSADIDLSLLGLQIMTWASDEKEWVRENPPAACYADTWAAYSEAIDLVYSAGGELTEAFGDLGPAATRFQTLASAANDAFGEAVTARESVAC